MTELASGSKVTIDGKQYQLVTSPHLYGDGFTGIEVTFEVKELNRQATRPVKMRSDGSHPDGPTAWQEKYGDF